MFFYKCTDHKERDSRFFDQIHRTGNPVKAVPYAADAGVGLVGCAVQRETQGIRRHFTEPFHYVFVDAVAVAEDLQKKSHPGKLFIQFAEARSCENFAAGQRQIEHSRIPRLPRDFKPLIVAQFLSDAGDLIFFQMDIAHPAVEIAPCGQLKYPFDRNFIDIRLPFQKLFRT